MQTSARLVHSLSLVYSEISHVATLLDEESFEHTAVAHA